MSARGTAALLLVLTALGAAGCGGAAIETAVRQAVPRAAVDHAPPPGSLPARVSPLRDPRGLHRGLGPVAAAERPKARHLIAKVAVAPRGSTAGYARTEDFGAAWSDAADVTWGHDGCPTREEVLHRDLAGIDFRGGTGECVVLAGILQDPYTARTIEFSKARPTEVQIDHVIPLAYAWAQGARGWTAAKRLRFANDPLNLLAVDGPTNQSKSDSGPAEWMPPNRALGCSYAVRLAQVSRKYRLPVPLADRRAMLRACP